MTREELIEFATWLDEGTDYFGKSYIEVKTDEWLQMKAENIVAKPVLGDSGCDCPISNTDKVHLCDKCTPKMYGC